MFTGPSTNLDCLSTVIGLLESSLKTISFGLAITNSETRLLADSCLQVTGKFLHRASDSPGVHDNQIGR